MNENTPIQFVTDEAGNKQAVLIPIKEWEKLQKELQTLLEYQLMKGNLFQAFSQMKQIKKGHLPKTSLRSFLNDC
ncbi:MAG: hypothetical protein AAF587_44595 [Bacteroidota bacterium]